MTDGTLGGSRPISGWGRAAPLEEENPITTDRTMDYRSDTLRVHYNSAVPEDFREYVACIAVAAANDWGLYHRSHYDKTTGSWAIDVTTYDPAAKHTVTDGQIADLLKSIAAEKGLSLSDLLKAAKSL